MLGAPATDFLCQQISHKGVIESRMNIKIHSSEINRMMKTISQCIDTRDIGNRANIEIGSLNNQLYIHSSNGNMIATMTTPMLGLDKDKFCVDGQMFAKVCAMCSGEIDISTDGKNCIIKGTGRTRLPIVNAIIPKHKDILQGKMLKVAAEDIIHGYNRVAHAVSADNSRIQLTGILMESVSRKLTMTALDGFQMSVESAECDGYDMRIIVPASFLKIVSQALSPNETVEFITDGSSLTACTDSMTITCGLLAGEYPPVDKILPTEFKTECLVKVDEIKNALKSGSVVNSRQNLVKMEIGTTSIKVMNNSEEADYEAEVSCETNGNGLMIAFNLKYLMNTMNTIDGETAVMHFNSSTSPCVVTEKDGNGIRLLLPVRVAQG